MERQKATGKKNEDMKKNQRKFQNRKNIISEIKNSLDRFNS